MNWQVLADQESCQAHVTQTGTLLQVLCNITKHGWFSPKNIHLRVSQTRKQRAQKLLYSARGVAFSLRTDTARPRWDSARCRRLVNPRIIPDTVVSCIGWFCFNTDATRADAVVYSHHKQRPANPKSTQNDGEWEGGGSAGARRRRPGGTRAAAEPSRAGRAPPVPAEPCRDPQGFPGGRKSEGRRSPPPWGRRRAGTGRGRAAAGGRRVQEEVTGPHSPRPGVVGFTAGKICT